MVGKGDERVFVALYVDDLLIVWNNKESLAKLKERLKEHFKMKDLGSAQFLLGVEEGVRNGCNMQVVYLISVEISCWPKSP